MNDFPSPTRTLFLEKVEIMCSIGLHNFERVEQQRVLVDVEIRLASNREPTADTVADTLDYDQVTNKVSEIAKARHYDLQETLARHIFDALIGLQDVDSLSVKTQKPDVYLNCETVAYRLSNIS